MSYTLAYWFLMFVLLIGGFWWGNTFDGNGRYPVWGWSIIAFLLFLLLGLKNFGAPLHG